MLYSDRLVPIVSDSSKQFQEPPSPSKPQSSICVDMRGGEETRMKMFLDMPQPSMNRSGFNHNSSLLEEEIIIGLNESAVLDNSRQIIIQNTQLQQQQQQQQSSFQQQQSPADNINPTSQSRLGYIQSNQQSSTVDKRRSILSEKACYNVDESEYPHVSGNAAIQHHQNQDSYQSSSSQPSSSNKNNSPPQHSLSQYNYPISSIDSISSNPNNNNNHHPKNLKSISNHDFWLKRFFVIVCLIGKFKYHIKKPLIFRNPDLLGKNQLMAIGDKGARGFEEAYKSNPNTKDKSLKTSKYRCIRRFKKRIKIVRKSLRGFWQPIAKSWKKLSLFFKKSLTIIDFPVFNPVNPIVVAWDILNMVLIFFYTLYISFNVAFGSHLEIIYFEIFAKTVFLTNLCIQCNLAYYEMGIKVSSRYYIIKNFLRNLLLNECLALFGIFQPNGHLLQLLMFFKYSQFQAVVRKYKENNQFSQDVNLIFQVLLLLTEIIQLCHFLCCGWYAIGEYNLNDLQQKSWLSDADRSSIRSIYIQSFYYCVISITTIGYGDITAKNDGERIFAICTALTASGFFAYTVNRMSSILDEYNKTSYQFRMQLNDINVYMNQRHVSNKLQDRARSYLEYVYREGYINKEKIKNSMNQLNKSLVQAIEGDVYYKTLKKFDFFGRNLSKNFLQRVALKLKEVNYAPDEEIFTCGEIGIPSVYFIQRGEVEIFMGSTKYQLSSSQSPSSSNNPSSSSSSSSSSSLSSSKSFCILKKDQQFGISEFLLQSQRRMYSARSKGITHLQYLQASDFFEMIRDFPRDMEFMANIKDRMLIHEDFQGSSCYCFSCKSSRHLIHQCPFVQYVPNTLKIFNNYLKAEKMTMKRFKRNEKRWKYNSVKNANVTERDVIMMLEQNKIIEWVKQEQVQDDINHNNRAQGQNNSPSSNPSIKLSSNILVTDTIEDDGQDNFDENSTDAAERYLKKKIIKVHRNIDLKLNKLKLKAASEDNQNISAATLTTTAVQNTTDFSKNHGGYMIKLIPDQEVTQYSQQTSPQLKHNKLIIHDCMQILQRNSIMSAQNNKLYDSENDDTDNNNNISDDDEYNVEEMEQLQMERKRSNRMSTILRPNRQLSFSSFPTSNNIIFSQDQQQSIPIQAYLSTILSQAITKKNTIIPSQQNNSNNTSKQGNNTNTNNANNNIMNVNTNNNNNTNLFIPSHINDPIVSLVQQKLYQDFFKKNQEFDIAQEYQIYFPYNNISVVLKKLNQKGNILFKKKSSLRSKHTFRLNKPETLKIS